MKHDTQQDIKAIIEDEHKKLKAKIEAKKQISGVIIIYDDGVEKWK